MNTENQIVWPTALLWGVRDDFKLGKDYIQMCAKTWNYSFRRMYASRTATFNNCYLFAYKPSRFTRFVCMQVQRSQRRKPILTFFKECLNWQEGVFHIKTRPWWFVNHEKRAKFIHFNHLSCAITYLRTYGEFGINIRNTTILAWLLRDDYKLFYPNNLRVQRMDHGNGRPKRHRTAQLYTALFIVKRYSFSAFRGPSTNTPL